MIALTIALAVIQATVSERPLWGGLNFGMPQAEVEAIHPNRSKIDLTPECPVEVLHTYRSGFLTRVSLRQANAMFSRAEGRRQLECIATVNASLDSKYGRGMVVPYAGPATSLERTNPTNWRRWRQDGLVITVETRNLGGEMQIVYERDPAESIRPTAPTAAPNL